MKTSVALIGFMGTGKSAVGKILAEKTGGEFIESDTLVEKQAGKTIPELFKDEGETGFREREIAAIKEIAGRENVVIACGGGVVLNTINIERLRETCSIVCLTASPSVIVNRIRQQAGQRPLLNGANELTRVKALLRYRRPFYERAADIIINTSRLTTDGVVERIMEALQS